MNEINTGEKEKRQQGIEKERKKERGREERWKERKGKRTNELIQPGMQRLGLSRQAAKHN